MLSEYFTKESFFNSLIHNDDFAVIYLPRVQLQSWLGVSGSIVTITAKN